MITPGPLASFHPAVAEWFRRRYPGGPTEAQACGWAAVASGEDTLIAAPTGSGKTLAAFLVAIDRCYRAAEWGEARRGTDVVYVSPLRALTVDVAQNLERPLAEIAAVAQEMGCRVPDVRVAVRNGDTPQSERAAMLRNRPEIVVTTPESLYLLLTSLRGRELLGSVRTVIVDEIHALARDKRGSHLAISLERLDRVVQGSSGPHRGDVGTFAGPVPRRPVRIGLSATQRPISVISRLLVGSGQERDDVAGNPRCTVVDVGHRRALDVAIELPDDELGAVFTHEQFAAVLDQIAAHISSNTTTLVFVNTRRLAERVAHRLGELVGEDLVQAHHGSLSMERRLRVESRLRQGELKAVVATASLELGIDIGPVELVCQIGSPRAIATWLQRVGRAQHHVGGTPTGRLYPQTRDELVECTALLAATRRGELDAIVPPVAPLDILAQQIVAEVATSGPEGISEAAIFSLVRGAAPYGALGSADFESVLDLVCDGVQTGRGRRGAYVHRDRVNAVLRPRRGARLTATTSGGAIPELADYRVVLEPEETFVGTVNEDWAIESMTGDVFLLGSHTWRIRRVESGTVRVVDAEGASPSVPFWLGEAPARTTELSAAISRLRAGVEEVLGTSPGSRPSGPGEQLAAAASYVRDESGVDARAAEQVIAYLATATHELGKLPTEERLVVERFFDETGGMQLVVHSPRGARINRGLGLALRKRFCRSFDFELQAAASDDAVVLSLGPQHSFPLAEVVSYLSPNGVTETLEQAVLPTPIFGSRWRWNLSRSLVAPRFRGSRHLPPAIQRMEADDLMAAIFPMLAACQENLNGPIVIPDHPVVRQTMDDCLTESIDLAGLTALLERLRDGELESHFVDSVGPSILSEEILNGRPYTYLDDAPLEERRTRAVQLRRGVPLEATDLSRLDPAVVAAVADQARPQPRDAEELHDLLCTQLLVIPEQPWEAWFAQLVGTGRAMTARLSGGEQRWAALERREAVEVLLEGVSFEPALELAVRTGSGEARPIVREDVVAEAVRAVLVVSPPLVAAELAEAIGIGVAGEKEVVTALARLSHEGSVLACRMGDDPVERHAARHLLMRVHARMREGARRAIEMVSSQQLMRFLVVWQHAGAGNRLIGVAGLAEVVEQLQGFEAGVGAWEASILPARVAGYQSGMLDDLCSQGHVGFGRLGARSPSGEAGVSGGSPRRPGLTPSPSTPISLFRREDVDWLVAALRGDSSAEEPLVGAPAEVIAGLRENGALFLTDLCTLTGRMPVEIADALWDGIARGLVTADGFQAVRGLLGGRGRLGNLVSHGAGHSSASPLGARSSRPVSRPRRAGSGRPRPRLGPALSGGRWSLLVASASHDYEVDELAEALAGQLLQRWGVVFRDLVQRELMGIGWREVLWALRRLEARGVVLGGRFVGGFTGEQFALPEAYEQLRTVARRANDGSSIRISAADPLNLTGIVLPGPRVPAVRTRTITLVDGAVSRGDDYGDHDDASRESALRSLRR
ncbi:MAG: DEAD/DEAH box helicase [Acidimicrobiales bacterium]